MLDKIVVSSVTESSDVLIGIIIFRLWLVGDLGGTWASTTMWDSP